MLSLYPVSHYAELMSQEDTS